VQNDNHNIFRSLVVSNQQENSGGDHLPDITSHRSIDVSHIPYRSLDGSDQIIKEAREGLTKSKQMRLKNSVK
jgi:hypothetical protein